MFLFVTEFCISAAKEKNFKHAGSLRPTKNNKKVSPKEANSPRHQKQRQGSWIEQILVEGDHRRRKEWSEPSQWNTGIRTFTDEIWHSCAENDEDSEKAFDARIPVDEELFFSLQGLIKMKREWDLTSQILASSRSERR